LRTDFIAEVTLRTVFVGVTVSVNQPLAGRFQGGDVPPAKSEGLTVPPKVEFLSAALLEDS
jgi:hypothetical protein